MKFNCDAKRDARAAARKRWTPWFAWFPVKVAYDDCRWLEYVERREDDSGWFTWEYRSVSR